MTTDTAVNLVRLHLLRSGFLQLVSRQGGKIWQCEYAYASDYAITFNLIVDRVNRQILNSPNIYPSDFWPFCQI